jgi:predicted AAA+ superfamily ATPase
VPAPEELCGYEAERELVFENTLRFLEGRPAQDVLLYGDRGTGKSTTVRALLARYRDRGLRLVQVDRRSLASLPRLWDAVEGMPQRFIAFVDDLSFDDGETDFRDAKVALQGGLRARPGNALVYATSNRRHLVRERFADGAAGEEARPGDAAEERLSLADRFGLTVIFAAPDQELYLRIAAHLARRRGIDLPEPELRRRALRFALWQGGRTGRTARQFVDGLEAELGPQA